MTPIAMSLASIGATSNGSDTRAIPRMLSTGNSHRGVGKDIGNVNVCASTTARPLTVRRRNGNRRPIVALLEHASAVMRN